MLQLYSEAINSYSFKSTCLLMHQSKGVAEIRLCHLPISQGRFLHSSVARARTIFQLYMGGFHRSLIWVVFFCAYRNPNAYEGWPNILSYSSTNFLLQKRGWQAIASSNSGCYKAMWCRTWIHAFHTPHHREVPRFQIFVHVHLDNN
jgi:hypothetical protein